MIPAMSGLARPEILATTEWLAENLGRSGIRVLDLRWRPDGSAPAVHASGHIPGAALVDWRADLIEDGDNGEAILLAGPDRMAALAARAGITDGTTVVVYDDTPEPVRGPRLVEPAGVRPRIRPGPRRRLPRLGRRGPAGLERAGRAAARPASPSAARTGRA